MYILMRKDFINIIDQELKSKYLKNNILTIQLKFFLSPHVK